MRKLLTLLLFGALCAVTVLPDEHPAHRTVESAVETAWNAGEEAVRVAREALSGYRMRDEDLLNNDSDEERGARSDDRGQQDEGAFVSGRAARLRYPVLVVV